MHSDGGVSEHSLWARGRHYNPFVYADGVISVRDYIHIEKFPNPSPQWGMQTT